MKYAEQVKANVRRSGGEWFLGSGIQEANGGVARYYFSDRERNAPVSTEITGYAISALVNLYRQTSDAGYLDAAIRAGTYLVTSWDDTCAAMPFECDGEGQKFSFFFDNGIIIRGLLSLWREFKKEEFLETAIKVGDSMGCDFVSEDRFAPILEMPGKTASPLDCARWSRSRRDVAARRIGMVPSFGKTHPRRRYFSATGECSISRWPPTLLFCPGSTTNVW